MTRYNEIMERVTVTPEMRERVLTNAVEAAEQTKKRSSPWKTWIAVAACLAVVLLGSLTLPKLLGGLQPSAQPTENLVQGSWYAEEFASAEALSKAAGFAVRDIPALLDSAAETSYLLISGELAQISYELRDRSYTYRVSQGSGDNSGDYREFQTTRSAKLNDIELICKGDASGCCLALWEAKGLSCSLAASSGIPYADMEELVRAAMGNP